MTRQRLPNRRGHELLTFQHEGIRYTAGVGRFEDGTLAEIFLNTAKQGTIHLAPLRRGLSFWNHSLRPELSRCGSSFLERGLPQDCMMIFKPRPTGGGAFLDPPL